MFLLRRLRRLLHRRRSEAEMAEEMQFHLEGRAADYTADGLPVEEARYAAQRKFGNLGSMQERAREVWGWGAWERFVKDVRISVRQLTKSPGFTLVAIVTLALGIGANTSMFSALNGILLRPLPYTNEALLERVYRVTPQSSEGHVSAADFLDFERAIAGLAEAAAFTTENASLSDPGQPADFAYGGRATVNLFSMLGVRPQLGRGFRAGEDAPGRDRVVILSQRIWISRYDRAADIIGRTIRIGGEPHHVIGVLPTAFNDWRHLGGIDFFRPLALLPEQAADRQRTMLRPIVQRAPDRSHEEVAEFVERFGARQAAAFPGPNAGSAWRCMPLRESVISGSGASTMKLLIGLSGFVLLIACSNLANLLLARTMSRAREFAIRGALGASRVQLLRSLVAESLLLALAGGALAILVALWFRDWAAMRSTGDNGEQVVFLLDWRVFGWTFGAALATSVAFGMAPALFALRLDLNRTLKSGGQGVAGGPGHRQFGRVLIIGQFSLAMILLTGAGLFVHALHEMNTRRVGWNSSHVVTGSVVLASVPYADADKVREFHASALERLTSLPGVTSASLSGFTPFRNWPESWKFIADGRERPPRGHEPAALVNAASPGYFDTFGMRLVAGRGFSEADTGVSVPVFILSETAARTFFGTGDPIGRRLAPASDGEPGWGEVVGVVSDVQSIVETHRAVNPSLVQVYHPITQPLNRQPPRQFEIAVRTAGPVPSTLVGRIRRTIAEVDPDLPVRRLQRADAAIRRENYQLAVLRDMLAAIAALGLGLATLGIYGVTARAMAQRTSEFAIRLALGARIEQITRLVLTSGVKLAVAGCAVGVLGSFALARFLASQFPDMDLDSPLVWIATTLLLVAVALVACWVPARRASKVDAMSVLRNE